MRGEIILNLNDYDSYLYFIVLLINFEKVGSV
ncbi:hypothetical protein JANLI_04030 [Janthinobacterium lividum]|nr:hypothetical protein JANLI_04030 [Janthinobacterium lividum]